MVTPYYNKATQTGLIKHYEYIADRVRAPHHPLQRAQPHRRLLHRRHLSRSLAQHPNINGVKEASGNFSLLAHTRCLCGDDFYIWSGNDDQVVPMMSPGRQGRHLRGVQHCARGHGQDEPPLPGGRLRGRRQAADRIHATFVDALFMEVNPIPVKAAMNLMGHGTSATSACPCARWTPEHPRRPAGTPCAPYGHCAEKLRQSDMRTKDHYFRLQRPHGPGSREHLRGRSRCERGGRL